MHEPDGFLLPLSSNGNLYAGTKSDLLTVFQNFFSDSETSPTAQNYLIDGAALVQMLRPVGVKTFDDYVKSSILQYVSTKAKNYERLHFVFDVYNPNSLKDATR